MITLKAADAPAALRASVVAVHQAGIDLFRQINTTMSETMGPAWRDEVTQSLTGAGRMEAAMLLPGTRIAWGNPPALEAANSAAAVGNGLVPNRHAAGYEFGAAGTTRTKQRVGRGKNPGRLYDRRAMRHLPARRRNGRVVYPAAARILPRIAAYWVQTVIRTILDAVETGQES